MIGHPLPAAPASSSGSRRAVAAIVALLAIVAAGATAATSLGGRRTLSAGTLQARVSNLAATHRHGYTTLTWSPVAGAEAYDIERTPVDAQNRVAGDSVVVGVWRPNRQVRQEFPAFADAGFRAGERFRWRVRARVGDAPQPWSDALAESTMAPSGPAEFHSEFERNGGAQYTSYDFEVDWTRRLVAASNRVRVVSIGKTARGKDINLFIFGMPAPRATAEEISRAPAAGANCIVHGNEPSGREGCFILMRDLAFSNEPWVIDLLSNATILIVPSLNGDGREANTRGNSAGQDLNRDHARLTQPETQAFAAFLRDYTPEVMVDGHEYGSAGTCDLPLLWSRHSNTAPSIHETAKAGMVEGWFYDRGARDGWWPCPYPPAGIPGAQTFTRVTGLKNMIVTLVEARSGGGPTRPDESNTAANRRRKAYSQMWAARQALEYHRANLPAVQKAIADGIAFQSSNTGPVVLHGDWDVTRFPAPHPGDTPPPNGVPGPDQIISPAPCGYLLTAEQYDAKLTDSGNLAEELRTSVGQRLAAHGVAVERVSAGYLVRLAQPLRGLINILLDERTPPAPIIGATRLATCPSS